MTVIKTYAHQLAQIATEIGTLPIGLAALHQQGIEKVPDVIGTEARKKIEAAKPLCAELGMRSSLIQINRVLDEEWQYYSTHSLAMALKETTARIIDDLSGVNFFYVPSRREEFYDQPWCGEKVETAFPSAITDIREGGKAFALGRWSASVFHAMGILQRGLYALARDLQVEFKAGFELENWKNIIDKLQVAIDDRLKAVEQTQSKGMAKDEVLTFYSRVAMEFQYFRHAWRNHVAHLREVYDEEHAHTVLTHVKQFMRRLAERLQEQA
jgi:hypothetical protein